MRPDLFLATIGRGSNGSNALEVTEDRAAVTAESQDNIINRVNTLSQYGPSWHYVPGIGVAGTAYAEVPGSALGDLAFSRASSKTRTNSAGVVETIAANVPPHDYRNADGTLSTFPRLNLEPQRTNSIRNSSMVGAVAGTPGTLPTNWSVTNAGLTQTVVGVGTESGLPYIDFRFNGTASGDSLIVRFDSPTAITASNGQTWSESVYIKKIAEPAPPTSYRLGMLEYTGAGVYIRIALQTITATTTLQRVSFTNTLSGGAGVGAVQAVLQTPLTIGTAYDFTIRIAAPQMELGAYATTWVPTTTAAVTRLADVAIKQNANFLPTGYPFTLFGEMHITNTASNFPISFIWDITSSNYFSIEQTGNTWSAIARPNTTAVSASATLTATLGTHKVAAVFTSTIIKLFVNGALIASAANNQSFNANINDLLIGQLRTVNDTGARTPIAQTAIFNSALSDAQCIQLTTL